jgi:uncharacterized Zn-finger protein
MENMKKDEKWQYTKAGACWYCDKIIKAEDVKDQRTVTHCPYCHTSFVD